MALRLSIWPALALPSTLVPLAAVATVVASLVLRLYGVSAIGFNSDEAVYTGQAAAIAGDPVLGEIFPVFRAHPLLFQTALSLLPNVGQDVLAARALSAFIGAMTVGVAFLAGRALYGPAVGLVAALFLALMPYHVVVTRQALLDGPMVLFTTIAIYTLARFGRGDGDRWLVAAGAAMGLAFLVKETAVIVGGSIYVFLALSPQIRLRPRAMITALAAFLITVAAFPIAAIFAGGATKTGQYFIWQLLRQPNHDWLFYLTVVPPAVGLLVVALAAIGTIGVRDVNGWRQRLLIAWVLVPVIYFQVWPTKGFQYLLPAAPALAMLAARAMLIIHGWLSARRHRLVQPGVIAATLVLVVAGSLALPSAHAIVAQPSTRFLAGGGGVPGGREAGEWVRANAPPGAQLMTIGPSMANILQFHGQRRAFGLSVSPNPLRRNPSYEPIINPDLALRNHEFQYIVWDAYSAARSPTFSQRLLDYANRYGGRVIHTEAVNVVDAQGRSVSEPVIVIYRVQP